MDQLLHFNTRWRDLDVNPLGCVWDITFVAMVLSVWEWFVCDQVYVCTCKL